MASFSVDICVQFSRALSQIKKEYSDIHEVLKHIKDLNEVRHKMNSFYANATLLRDQDLYKLWAECIEGLVEVGSELLRVWSCAPSPKNVIKFDEKPFKIVTKLLEHSGSSDNLLLSLAAKMLDSD